MKGWLARPSPFRSATVSRRPQTLLLTVSLTVKQAGKQGRSASGRSPAGGRNWKCSALRVTVCLTNPLQCGREVHREVRLVGETWPAPPFQCSYACPACRRSSTLSRRLGLQGETALQESVSAWFADWVMVTACLVTLIRT